ncbi:hypothetical protein [Massilia sp. LC238]|uniref:hypothetical protein n=1 Tax=Massilia sp. LC238 TaxID=1502852 RepID=UPI0004E3BF7F|nr:hypothetical protein [Massilia sp. LC238]KFC61933.1 hypothetical protein FG94_04973 [Massilia sp. LC238]
MATTTQLTRVIALIVEDAVAQHPTSVEQRALSFAQMLCGALTGLDYKDAAVAIRIMLGTRAPAPADGA